LPVQNLSGWQCEVAEKPKDQQGFVVLSEHWVVERTFAWLASIVGRARTTSLSPRAAIW